MTTSASMYPQLVSQRPIPDVAPTCLQSAWSPRSCVLDTTQSSDDLCCILPPYSLVEDDKCRPGELCNGKLQKIFEIPKIRIRLLFFWLDMYDCSLCRQNQKLYTEARDNTPEHPKPRRIPIDSARAVCTEDRTDRNPENGYFQPEINRCPVPGSWNSTTLSSDICSHCKSVSNCLNLCYLDSCMFMSTWHLLLDVRFLFWERLN